MKDKTGIITKERDGFKVKFERTYNHDIKVVWDAITNPDKLKMWFTDFKMEFRPGGKLTITFRDEGRTESYGEIISIDPPHRFEYTWEGELAVWELYSLEGNKCRLVFTYSGISDEYAMSVPAGFHTLLDRLEDMLDGNSAQYPFGAEENDPELKKLYESRILAEYPEMERYAPIVMEITYNASVEKVWRAITDKDQMKQWYFDLAEFKPEVGFEFQFAGQGHKGEKYIHLCRVTEVVPLKKLKYSWSYQGYEGMSFLTFELTALGDKTALKLTHEGLGSFPDHPDFAGSSFNQGWTELLGKLLKEFLEKG